VATKTFLWPIKKHITLDPTYTRRSLVHFTLVFLVVTAPTIACHVKPFYFTQHYLFRRTSTLVSILIKIIQHHIEPFAYALNHLSFDSVIRHYSAVARLDLLGGQSRAPKAKLLGGSRGMLPVKILKYRVSEIAFSAFRKH